MYKTYCKEIPITFKGVTDSFCNKPMGGLWGCRGDEWKDWCESEEFNLDGLSKSFKWKLKQSARIFTIKEPEDFAYLLEWFSKSHEVFGKEIDYLKLKEKYDAVETVGDIVYQLRYGYGNNSMGLYSWDVPSICVLNPEVIERI